MSGHWCANSPPASSRTTIKLRVMVFIFASYMHSRRYRAIGRSGTDEGLEISDGRLPRKDNPLVSRMTTWRSAMATPKWNLNGQYYETCSCDFVCPCLPGQMAVRPTKGSCTFAMAFQIDRGTYGNVSLNGLGFIVLGLTTQEMGTGNWFVGVIADERASVEQRDAITAIASGSAGGPMAVLASLVGKFLGVASAAILFDRKAGPGL